MSIPWIVVGDKTTGGGTVLTGSSVCLNAGKAVARKGDMATCPIQGHGGQSPIVSGCDEDTYVEGAPVALDGAALACGCRCIAGGASEIAAKNASKNNSLFTDAENEKIRQALKAQRNMLEKKQTELSRWNASDQAKFKQAFGTTDESARKTISDRVDKMHALNKSMTVDNFKPPNDPKFKSAFAYVYPKDASHSVYLGDAFWKASATGQDSQAGTMAHEFSHFNDVGGTKDGFPSPSVYGLGASRALATTDSAKALMHADSFEYWVEDVP